MYILDCFISQTPYDIYKEQIFENSDLKSTKELEENVNKNFNELETRKSNLLSLNYFKDINVHYIDTITFIKEQYRNVMLFYCLNHPSKHIIQYICSHIKKLVSVKSEIDFNIDVFNRDICIMYKCIEKIVNFKVKDYPPFLFNQTQISDIFETMTTYYQENYISDTVK